MSGGLDYAKEKRRQAGRHGEPISDTPYRFPSSLRGWRTEWDGEPFPVTVTRPSTPIQTPDNSQPESEAA